MPSPHGRRLRAFARVLGGIAVVSLLAFFAASGSARGDSISQKKAEAARIEREIQSSQMRLEGAIQNYDHANQQLENVRRQVVENKRMLVIARANLTTAQAELSAFLVSSYKGENQTATAIFVLGANSLTDLVNRVEFINHTALSQQKVLNQVIAYRHQVTVHAYRLRVAERRAGALVKQAAAAKRTVESELASQHQMLAGVQSDIRQLIAQHQAYLRRLAAERAAKLRQQQASAAAAAAAAAAATTAPPASTGDAGGGGTAIGTPGGSAPPPSSIGQEAVAIAERYLGVPYVWGGASPSGFDCSGLTMYVYAQLGVHLDHYTGDQWNEGTHVTYGQLAPGDLVFFYPGEEHVGIYIGGGLFIHAPHTGTVVQISSLSGYYAAVFDGGVRVA